MMGNCVVSFLLETFRPDTKEEKEKNKKISCCWESCCCCCMCIPMKLCPYLVNGLKLYNAISFLSFFLTAVCFSTNLAVELILETSSPKRNLTLQNFYIACTSFLVISVTFNSFYFLSLFWEVVEAVMYKTAVKYNILRFVLLVVDLIAGGIWFSKSHSGFDRFVTDVIIVSYVKAGILTVLGSVFLVFYVFTKRNTKIFPRLDRRIVDCGFVDLWNNFWNVVCCIGILFFHIVFIISPVAYALSEAPFFSIALSIFLPYFSASILAILVSQGSRTKDSGFVLKPFVLVLMLFVCLVLIIFFCLMHYQCGPECQLGLPKKNARQTRDLPKNLNIPGYAICDKKWSKLELGITDMAFLADLAYKIDTAKERPEKIIKTKVDYYFQDRSMSWEVLPVNRKKPSFYHIHNAAKKVNIISIRGTSDWRDWLENLKIWNEIAIFQIFFSVVSIKNLPEKFVSTYVSVAACLEYAGLDRHSYVKKLEEYIIKETNDNRDEEFVLVGHSLGGGLAKIVGTRNKIPAIGFSSPGEVYNHIKYGYTLEDLEKYTTTFGAQNDLISWIDKPGGLVQNVRCSGNCGFFEVHSIKNTYYNLKKNCPV